MAGIGTRFPIRVVSRRTAQGSRNRFRIYMERAPQDVKGLQRANASAENYSLEGDTLTMDAFEAALEDLSENYIGIRKGTGPETKNFVPDIVTVDLSGPNRSLFNILDLPGLIFSDFGVNEPELLGTQELAKQYISRPENTIIRPGLLESESMDLRQELNLMNTQFDNVMRWVGGFWKFDDEDIDPLVVCLNYEAFIDNKQDRPETAHQILYPTTEPKDYKKALEEIPAFEEHEHVEPFERFVDTVNVNLRRFGASQPPGVVNSDIYPVIYRVQVSKWGSIAQEHLERVKDAMKSSYEEILHSVCPDSGSTSTLHHELKTRLHSMFCETFNKAKQDLEVYCEQETQKELLQTTNQQFRLKLVAWRMLRYARAFYQGIGGEKAQNLISSQTLGNMWSCMDLSSENRMMYDIHDVIKVYYEVSLESFIRHVTQTIVEGFVMDKNGPLSKLTTEYVLSLSEEEVGKITREDKITGQLREQLKNDIMKFEGAQEIAKTARDKVEALKGT
ncbi:hypothetical protein IL306_005110 [Fusarium sp. DS 682]|nr:hypothetical protein IL306_005110 [Fusarium sp. DS 682]